ncbi:UTP-GlnB uridylyltransferase, GlnD, partial [Plesiocystis pacifica SIR-1]
ARDVLLRLRAALHLVAGRTQDRLNFQYQEGVPAVLGLLPEEAGGPGESARLDDAVLVAAIEACMQDYYRAASDVRRYGSRVFARCQPPRSGAEEQRRIDERFHTDGDRLFTYGRNPFASSPVLGLEALVIARDRNLRPSGPLLDGLLDCTAAIPEGDTRLAEDPAAQARFLDLLVDTRDVGAPTPLERVHDVGYLERLVPEFAASRGRMQHEGFHVYTVDQHSLYAVEFLKAVARGEHRRDYPMATVVHLNVESPEVLYLSTLLHDAGKPFGDQCAEGARIARLAAARAGLGETDRERCALLVQEHQTMPMLSQKRDLSDPLLVREFAELVGDRRTLDELYLVSLADMANVSPDYLTSWKLSLLDELYLRAAARISELESGARKAGRTTRRRPQESEPEGLPERYYSLYDQEMRREHRRLLDALAERGEADAISGAPPSTVLVEVAVSTGALRVTVVTPDRPGLLALLTGSFAELGLTVVAADVFSVPAGTGIALDVFRVVEGESRPGRTSGPVKLAEELEHAFAQALSDAPSAEALGEPLPPMPRTRTRRGRRRRVPTRVRFSEDPGGQRTIVDVETVGSPDVAARITRAFAARGTDIEIARLNTEMRRAEAVFYVQKLGERARGELAKAIRANLRTRRR